MRATLLEVVGQPLYSDAWLRQRVLWHLDPEEVQGQVLVAYGPDYLGHTIVRVDDAESGLFSTTYVLPRARRRGVARLLIAQGETWMTDRGLRQASTYTAATNQPLQQLYQSMGYTLRPVENGFVQLVGKLHRGETGNVI